MVFERDNRLLEPQPRLQQGGYVLDYKGCEISWPEVRLDASRWTVNLSSNDRGLLAKLGGCVVIDDFKSLENAIAKARRHVDELELSEYGELAVGRPKCYPIPRESLDNGNWYPIGTKKMLSH